MNFSEAATGGVLSKNLSSCFGIDSFLSSDNLLTGYEQLRYQQFNRNLSIYVPLVKDWFMLHQKFNQEDLLLNFLSKYNKAVLTTAAYFKVTTAVRSQGL